MSEQVIHHVVILLIKLHHSVVGWNKRPQSVLHQPEVALLLALTKPLQQCAVSPNMKAPCEARRFTTTSIQLLLLPELDSAKRLILENQTCMSDHLQPLLRLCWSVREERRSHTAFWFLPRGILHQKAKNTNLRQSLLSTNTFQVRLLFCGCFSVFLQTSSRNLRLQTHSHDFLMIGQQRLHGNGP